MPRARGLYGPRSGESALMSHLGSSSPPPAATPAASRGRTTSPNQQAVRPSWDNSVRQPQPRFLANGSVSRTASVGTTTSTPTVAVAVPQPQPQFVTAQSSRNASPEAQDPLQTQQHEEPPRKPALMAPRFSSSASPVEGAAVSRGASLADAQRAVEAPKQDAEVPPATSRIASTAKADSYSPSPSHPVAATAAAPAPSAPVVVAAVSAPLAPMSGEESEVQRLRRELDALKTQHERDLTELRQLMQARDSSSVMARSKSQQQQKAPVLVAARRVAADPRGELTDDAYLDASILSEVSSSAAAATATGGAHNARVPPHDTSYAVSEATPLPHDASQLDLLDASGITPIPVAGPKKLSFATNNSNTNGAGLLLYEGARRHADDGAAATSSTALYDADGSDPFKSLLRRIHGTASQLSNSNSNGGGGVVAQLRQQERQRALERERFRVELDRIRSATSPQRRLHIYSTDYMQSLVDKNRSLSSGAFAGRAADGTDEDDEDDVQDRYADASVVAPSGGADTTAYRLHHYHTPRGDSRCACDIIPGRSVSLQRHTQQQQQQQHDQQQHYPAILNPQRRPTRRSSPRADAAEAAAASRSPSFAETLDQNVREALQRQQQERQRSESRAGAATKDAFTPRFLEPAPPPPPSVTVPEGDEEQLRRHASASAAYMHRLLDVKRVNDDIARLRSSPAPTPRPPSADERREPSPLQQQGGGVSGLSRTALEAHQLRQLILNMHAVNLEDTGPVLSPRRRVSQQQRGRSVSV